MKASKAENGHQPEAGEKSDQIFNFHLLLGLFLYTVFASSDAWLTLNGMKGNLALEGNPIMRSLMSATTPLIGLIIGKGTVLLCALALSIPVHRGIHEESPWVYRLALTRITKAWMKRKRRYWVAFVPVYLVALSQALAALAWIWLKFN